MEDDVEKNNRKDLFAGPSKQLLQDSITGKLLKSSHPIHNMDALINTFHPTQLPNELINMQRETGERKNKHFIPFPIQQQSLLKHQQNLNLNLESKSNSILNQYSINQLEITHRSKLPIPTSSKQHISSKLLLLPPPPLPITSQPPLSSHLPSNPIPEIPSIHQIIQKYSSQIQRSSIPLKSSSSLKKSSSPHSSHSTFSSPILPLRPSTSHQLYHPQPPSNSIKSHQSNLPSTYYTQINQSSSTRKKKKSSKLTSHPGTLSDDSISSIHSLTKEALKLPQLSTVNLDPSNSSSSQLLNQPPSSIDPISHRPQKQRVNSDSTSKTSYTRFNSIPEPGSPSYSSTCTQAETDDYIAQYLRSSQLTTLIKLERQQTPMTVSLADVGSSTGHPVIVYLGLGCVRYLVGLYHELAEALGLRLICIDRWGLGKTTEVPDDHRSFTEWASVVEEVLDHLGIQKFSILAHSAGAPYALASSLRFGDRIHGSIHLLAPWVSMTSEGGIDAGAYKWLRYVPNSMIKTVQTAEWKMTGWRLGKLPKLNYPPIGFDAHSTTPPTPSSQSFHHHSTIYSDSSSDPSNSKIQSEQYHKRSKATIPRLRSSSSSSSSDSISIRSSSSSSSRSSGYHPKLENYKENQKAYTIIPTTTAKGGTDTHNHRTVRRRLPNDLKISEQSIDDLDSLFEQPDRVLIEIEKKKSLLLTSNNRNLSNGKVTKASHHYGASSSSNPSPKTDLHHKQRSNGSSTTTAATPKKNSAKSRNDSEDSWLDLSHSLLNRSDSIPRTCTKNDAPSVGNHRIAERSTNVISEAPIVSSPTRGTSLQGLRGQRKVKNSTSSSTHSHSNATHQAKDSAKEGSDTRESGIGGMRRTLGISLLRASYSESLKGGASDLITILEKDSKKKPWGFKYSEIIKPVKIWHGDKDEKLSVKGSEFFLSSILLEDVKKHSKLFIVKEANHSLMTNVNVIFQVFESIADQWTLPFPFA